MTSAAGDRNRRERLDRLAKLLDRVRMKTERDAELYRALEESERAGARRERERCAAWLESLECGDDATSLLVQKLARALRCRGMTSEL
jgi:hypothetical protein